jgi:hypothetical protein
MQYQDIAAWVTENKTTEEIVELRNAIRLPDIRVGGGATMDALLIAGVSFDDVEAVYGAIAVSNVGKGLLALLSGEEGVNWADYKTIALLGRLRDSIPDSPVTQEVIDTLFALSARYVEPTTLEEVQAVIDAENQRVQDAAEAEALETARMELWQTWQDVYNANISPVLDGTEPTVANLDAGIVAGLAALRGE